MRLRGLWLPFSLMGIFVLGVVLFRLVGVMENSIWVEPPEPVNGYAYYSSRSPLGHYSPNSTPSNGANYLRGQMLFKENCARCHSTNLVNDLTGPGLEGLMERMAANQIERETLKAYIRNADSVQKVNVYFGELFEEWNGTIMDRMPHLTDEDLEDMLEWIEAWVAPVYSNEVVICF